MRVGDAKQIAREWVHDEWCRLPAFVGAYFTGSVNWLTDDADLPPTSDLDVNVVVGTGGAKASRHKHVQGGVLLEVSVIPLAQVSTPEQVLGDFALAGGFRAPSVILDPTGHLGRLQAEVAQHFANPTWVRRRIEHARGRMFDHLDALNDADPLHLQMIVWLFGSSILTLLPLVAGLRNPTVRRRYAAVREILAENGRLDLYEQLLEQLGCASMGRRRVEHHLAAVTDLFDVASDVIRTPFPFETDISTLARPAAIDGSRDLIERGLHREAVWWLAVTSSRCQAVLAADAPAEAVRFLPGYLALLADLGVASFADRQQRAEQARALAPRVQAVAEQILEAR